MRMVIGDNDDSGSQRHLFMSKIIIDDAGFSLDKLHLIVDMETMNR